MGVERETPVLGQDDSYFKQLPRMLQLKRDEVYAALKEVGMDPIIPQGGYFMLANISKLGMSNCVPLSNLFSLMKCQLSSIHHCHNLLLNSNFVGSGWCVLFRPYAFKQLTNYIPYRGYVSLDGSFTDFMVSN